MRIGGMERHRVDLSQWWAYSMEKSNTTLRQVYNTILATWMISLTKKGVFISKVNILNARFIFVSSGVKGHQLQTYCCSFYGCQTWDLYGKHVNQLNAGWSKTVRKAFQSAIQNSSPVAIFDSQWKIFQNSALQSSSQIYKRIFSSENI